MKKWLTISSVISILHFGEDLALVLLGRFTDIHIWMILVGTLIFGWLVASLSQIPIVKRFLSK